MDFTRYQDGTRTRDGDEIYLTNILSMRDGRKPDGDRGEYVPMLKIVIDGDGVSSFYAYDVNGLEFEFTHIPVEAEGR